MYFYSNLNSLKLVIFSIALFGSSMAFGSQPGSKATLKAPQQSKADIAREDVIEGRVTDTDMGYGLMGSVGGFFTAIGVMNFFAPKTTVPLNAGKVISIEDPINQKLEFRAAVASAALGGICGGYLSYSHRQQMLALKREHRAEMEKKKQEQENFLKCVSAYFQLPRPHRPCFNSSSKKAQYHANIFTGIISEESLSTFRDQRDNFDEELANADVLEAHILHSCGWTIGPQRGNWLPTPKGAAALRDKANTIAKQVLAVKR